MRVWVVGAGAIGGTVAARLARPGVADPVVVDADPEHVQRLRDPGIELSGLDTHVNTVLRAYTPEEAESLDEGCDLLLLAVRSSVTEAALRPHVGRLAEAGDVVSLQNGLNEERIAALVGADRTIGCVVGFGATWLEPGRIEVTSDGELVVGRLDGRAGERVDAVRDLLHNAFPARTTTNITGALWGKMIVNSMTVLGALGGTLLGEQVADEPGRAVTCEVIAEAVAVARAGRVDLPLVLGMVEPDLVAERADGWLEKLHHALEVVAHHFGAIKSVTLRDFELGRPVEIDAVTGEVVRRGQEHRVPTPVSAAAYTMLKEIEAGQREIGPANLVALGDLLG